MNPVLALYDALNRKDVSGIVDQFTETAELLDMPSGSVVRGKKMLTEYFQNWLNAFPDGKGEIKNLIEKDDLMVAETMGTGTLQGTFSTPHGALMASGRKVVVRFCQLFRVQAGKIVSSRTYYDMAGIIAQARAEEQPGRKAA